MHPYLSFPRVAAASLPGAKAAQAYLMHRLLQAWFGVWRRYSELILLAAVSRQADSPKGGGSDNSNRGQGGRNSDEGARRHLVVPLQVTRRMGAVGLLLTKLAMKRRGGDGGKYGVGELTRASGCPSEEYVAIRDVERQVCAPLPLRLTDLSHSTPLSVPQL